MGRAEGVAGFAPGNTEIVLPLLACLLCVLVVSSVFFGHFGFLEGEFGLQGGGGGGLEENGRLFQLII